MNREIARLLATDPCIVLGCPLDYGHDGKHLQEDQTMTTQIDPETTPEYHGAETATDADYQGWITRELKRLGCHDATVRMGGISISVSGLVATFEDTQERWRYSAVEALAALRKAEPYEDLDGSRSGFAGAWQALAALPEVPKD